MISCDLDVSQELEVYPKGVKGALILSHITGIGKPYSLSCNVPSEDTDMLDVNLPVTFKRIADKHCSETVFDGILTAISEKNAILKTHIPIRQFENISLLAENEIFCKVLRVGEQGLLLGFTAGHNAFCARVMNGNPAK
jgi:hypothetical protein